MASLLLKYTEERLEVYHRSTCEVFSGCITSTPIPQLLLNFTCTLLINYFLDQFSLPFCKYLALKLHDLRSSLINVDARVANPSDFY